MQCILVEDVKSFSGSGRKMVVRVAQGRDGRGGWGIFGGRK